MMKKRDKMIEEIYRTYLEHPMVQTDTRAITPGCLFFCLKGENFDGNDFALQALTAGAAAVVTNRADLRGRDGFFVVDDTLATLQALANHHRRQFRIPFIGITGTNGKTTTKELITTVLRMRYRVACTQGNFNNHIGVPLTLLSIAPETEVAVVEMGANHPGEIAGLCEISEPDYGVITNIGVAHIEGFGSRENIVKTKRALYESVMKRGGTIFVNGDDATLVECAGGYGKQVRYGTGEGSVCRGRIADMDPYLTVTVDNVTFRTHLAGAYNLANILSAIAVGRHFGIDLKQAAAAIEGYVPANHRSQIERVGDNTLIADYYNANPTSMAAAIDNLSRLSQSRKCAVLGDMLELGEVSATEHRHIVELCSQHDIEAYFVGSCFQQAVPSGSHAFANVVELNDFLEKHPIHNAIILIKGSRGMHLEKCALVPANA